MSVTVPIQQAPVAVGGIFVATLPAPPAGLTSPLGARVEQPLSEAIVSSWQQAVVTANGAAVTLEAPLAAGLYNLVWMTADSPPQFREIIPLQVTNSVMTGYKAATWPAPAVDQVTPTVDDVALLERTRTLDNVTGAPLSTFTENTRPTRADAEQIIGKAVNDVLAMMRPTFNPAHWPQVRTAITFYAAMMIEGSFYREQAAEGTVLWQAEYREAMKMLNDRIEQEMAQNNLLGTMEPHATALA